MHLREEGALTLVLETERLILRRFVPDDVQAILEFVSHPSVSRVVPEIGTTEGEITKYVGIQGTTSLFEKDQCTDLAIERKADGRVIGMLTLVCRDHRQAEIGYALGVEHRGQGYGTEAARALMEYGFNSLELHRIEAKTSTGNPDSWQVMERLGMRREAQLREAEMRESEWVDVLIYGILASDSERSD
jgi:RimJ/RimL family protein N-acetyltransferase